MTTPAQIAETFASQFEALSASERKRIARQFREIYERSEARHGDPDEAYSDAYHADDLYGLLDRFTERHTGGADWAVDNAWSIAANEDEEGLFLIDDMGSWSLAVRWFDEDDPQGAVIEEFLVSDEWPQVVNVAHRLANALEGKRSP